MNRVPPEPLFDPKLLSLDNAAEEFWQEYKRKQEEMSLPETEAEAEKRFMECTARLKAANRDSDIFQLKQRAEMQQQTSYSMSRTRIRLMK